MSTLIRPFTARHGKSRSPLVHALGHCSSHNRYLAGYIMTDLGLDRGGLRAMGDYFAHASRRVPRSERQSPPWFLRWNLLDMARRFYTMSRSPKADRLAAAAREKVIHAPQPTSGREAKRLIEQRYPQWASAELAGMTPLHYKALCAMAETEKLPPKGPLKRDSVLELDREHARFQSHMQSMALSAMSTPNTMVQ